MIRRFTAQPRTVQVLMVWAVASALSLAILLAGAVDTPATPWAGASPSYVQHISFWDSGWYARIARTGYPSTLPTDAYGAVAENAWAFMPLFPLLAKALEVTGISFYVAGAAVSAVASAVAAVLLDRWLAPRTGANESLWAVALMWCSPCAVVLQVPYAEALALALIAGALLLSSRGRFLAAAPLVVLAALTRPVGVPLAVTYGLWWLWETTRANDLGPGWLRSLVPDAALTASQRLRLLALACVAGVSAVTWPVIAWVVTGRVDAYTAAETAWRDSSLLPFAPWLTRAWTYVGGHLGWMLLVGFLLVVVLVLSAPAARRLGAAAWFWCLGYVLYLLAFFDPTTSLLRLLLPLAPLAWAASATLVTPRLRAVILVLCVVGQLFWVSWVWDLNSVSIPWVP